MTVSTSILVTGGNREKRDRKIQELLAVLGKTEGRPDVLSVGSEDGNAIGVNDVRNLAGSLHLQAVSGSQVAVVPEAENLTREAQNALLKILEEPPAGSTIILAAERQDYLLSTVVSRCQVIALPEETQTAVAESEKPELIKVFTLVGSGKADAGFRLVQNLKDRGEAKAWLEKLIVVGREELYNNPSPETAGKIRRVLNTARLIKDNANTRLALENLFLP